MNTSDNPPIFSTIDTETLKPVDSIVLSASITDNSEKTSNSNDDTNQEKIYTQEDILKLIKGLVLHDLKWDIVVPDNSPVKSQIDKIQDILSELREKVHNFTAYDNSEYTFVNFMCHSPEVKPIFTLLFNEILTASSMSNFSKEHKCLSPQIIALLDRTTINPSTFFKSQSLLEALHPFKKFFEEQEKEREQKALKAKNISDETNITTDVKKAETAEDLKEKKKLEIPEFLSLNDEDFRNLFLPMHLQKDSPQNIQKTNLHESIKYIFDAGYQFILAVQPENKFSPTTISEIHGDIAQLNINILKTTSCLEVSPECLSLYGNLCVKFVRSNSNYSAAFRGNELSLIFTPYATHTSMVHEWTHALDYYISQEIMKDLLDDNIDNTKLRALKDKTGFNFSSEAQFPLKETESNAHLIQAHEQLQSIVRSIMTGDNYLIKKKELETDTAKLFWQEALGSQFFELDIKKQEVLLSNKSYSTIKSNILSSGNEKNITQLTQILTEQKIIPKDKTWFDEYISKHSFATKPKLSKVRKLLIESNRTLIGFGSEYLSQVKTADQMRNEEKSLKEVTKALKELDSGDIPKNSNDNSLNARSTDNNFKSNGENKNYYQSNVEMLARYFEKNTFPDTISELSKKSAIVSTIYPNKIDPEFKAKKDKILLTLFGENALVPHPFRSIINDKIFYLNLENDKIRDRKTNRQVPLSKSYGNTEDNKFISKINKGNSVLVKMMSLLQGVKDSFFKSQNDLPGKLDFELRLKAEETKIALQNKIKMIDEKNKQRKSIKKIV